LASVQARETVGDAAQGRGVEIAADHGGAGRRDGVDGVEKAAHLLGPVRRVAVALEMHGDEQGLLAADGDRRGHGAATADAAFATVAVEPVAVGLDPDEHRRCQRQVRENPVAVQADLVGHAGAAPLLLFVAQTQLEKLRAEDVAAAERGSRVPEAVALTRARHADVDLAQQDDVGGGAADERAAGIEAMEPLRVPAGDAQRPGPGGRGGSAGFDELQGRRRRKQIAVRFPRRPQGQHAVPRGALDRREVDDDLAVGHGRTRSTMHIHETCMATGCYRIVPRALQFWFVDLRNAGHHSRARPRWAPFPKSE